VSTLTLDRPRATKTRNKTSSPKLSHSPRRLYARKSNTPSPAKLQELEDRLLAAALAHHPDSDRAIAHLLDDVEQLPAGHPTRQLTPLRRHHQLERMDDLLIQAMMRTHPNHDCAIDRLFAEIVSSPMLSPTPRPKKTSSSNARSSTPRSTTTSTACRNPNYRDSPVSAPTQRATPWRSASGAWGFFFAFIRGAFRRKSPHPAC
jgi:hypothetical protein